jgi:predicted PurR-regulated permease PerM
VATTSREASRREVSVSISIRTIVLAAIVVAVGTSIASIKSVLLVILVSGFGVAVLSPLATGMERRLGWSRRVCSTLLVLAIMVVMGAVALVMVQAVSSAVHDFSRDLPQIVDRAKQSNLGNVLNTRSGSLDTLTKHTGEITQGAGKVSGGVAHVGISAFGAITVIFSVIFLTLFGLIDEPHLRKWTAGLLYRDKRERYLRVTDRIIHTTSRYMLGNVAISVVCGTVYGVTAVILELPYPLALAVIAAILDLVPNIGATLAGVLIGIVALSVSLEALIVFLLVIVVYQLIENYILQPTIIGKAAKISGFTVLASVLAFGALFGLIGAIIGVPIAAAMQIVLEERPLADVLASPRRTQLSACRDGLVRRPVACAPCALRLHPARGPASRLCRLLSDQTRSFSRTFSRNTLIQPHSN